MFEVELSKWDKFLMKINWYSFCRFINNWVYPGYDLRNLLFHRHDRIKVPQIKPWEYCDVTGIMLYANMELIVKFIEQENPEKHICWYQDEIGEDVGHKYGEYKNADWLYPEYNGKFIMDIIKEIYHFWKVECPEIENDFNYIQRFWSENFFGTFKEKDGEEGVLVKSEDNIAKSIEELKGEVKWEILDKYIDRDKMFEHKYVFHKMNEIEIELEKKTQKYLHLCIEVRPFLWT